MRSIPVSDPHARYRPEIDGLRAVAVVPVVLFHAGVPGLGGGFVGVDVFFVISGFLITGILAADVEAGRFSILRFYERRVRRIFPALFAMLAVCCLLAVGLLLPFELEAFAGSLTAAALFVSNVFFMQGAGYFVAAAETQPLLHTWSLSIEEQFYIAFPVYLYLMHRYLPRWLLPATAAFCALSLAGCVLWTHPQNDLAFFYTPARVWELLVGSMLALAARRAPLPGAVAEVAGVAGLMLIAVAVFGFDARTPFPGAAAILPVAGTALVLGSTAGNRTTTGALLALPPVRFFGLISYSLYLWHWPLLVFYRLWRVAPPAPWEIALVVVASVAAAAFSWRFVERPFRRRAVLADRPRLLVAGATAIAGAVLVGQTMGGMPGRIPTDVAALEAVRFDEVGFAHCDSLPGGRPCLIGGGAVEAARFVVWGDSHAGMLMPAFEAAAESRGVTGLYLGAAGCVPLIGVDQLRWGFQTCSEGSARILQAIAEQRELETVVLVSRWAFYAEGERFGHEAGHPVFIRDEATVRPSLMENGLVFERGLARTVEALTGLGRRVVIVAQAPENEFDLPVAMARARWLGHEVAFAPSRADYLARQALVMAAFERSEATVVDLGAVLCGDLRCPVVRAGVPLYRDSNHLTATYGRELGPVFEPVLGSALD